MKVQTEVGDKSQYIAHQFNDNTIRFVLKYPCRIDAQRLEKAMEVMVQRLDILHSSFYVGIWGTRWDVNENYETSGFMDVSEAEGDVLEAAKQAALLSVDYSRAVQVRCCLFSNQSESAFAFLVGHMCADGRDAVYLLKKLIEIYNALSEGGTGEEVALKSGNRSVKQCYSGDPEMLSFDVDKLILKKISEIKSAYCYLTEEEGVPGIAECIVPKESISRRRKLVKDATVNDVILAAYFRAYVKQMNLTVDTPVGMASMMDLRKYIPESDSAGIANLSGPISINLASGIGSDFEYTLSEVTRQNTALKKDKKAGLDFILAIQKMYKVIPFPLVVRAGEKVYGNMSIGMTNLGNIKGEQLVLEKNAPDALIFAGPRKKKPALQLSVSGLDGEVRLCIVSECTPEELAQLENLLEMITWEIEEA